MNIEGQRTAVLWDESMRQRVLDVIEALPMDPLRPWSLVLRPPFREITGPQRGYYRGHVLRLLCDATGFEEDEMHAYLLHVHGDRALIDVHHADYCLKTFTMGENNTGPEMRQFLERVLRWAAVVPGVFIPPPGGVELC